MNISKKLPLVQLLLTVIFSGAVSVIAFFYVQIGNLRILSSQMDNLQSDMEILERDLSILPQKIVDYYELNQQLKQREELINEGFKNLQHTLSQFQERFPELSSLSELNKTNWESILAGTGSFPGKSFHELQTLISDLGETEELYSDEISIRSLQDQLLLMDPELFPQIYDKIRYTLSLNRTLQFHLESTLIPSLDLFNQEINEFAQQMTYLMRRGSILLAMLIFTAGILIGLIIAKRISRNLVILDKSISQVASGNLHFSLTSIGNDEFKQIGDNFNNLTNTLWFRLDSLKDLMRDLGSSVEDDTDQKTLLETVLELSMDSTGAESGIIMLYQEDSNSLQLEAMLGNFPPPVKVPGSVMMNENYLKEWFHRYQMKMGETLIGEAAQRKTYFFVKDNFRQELFPNNSDPDSSLFISSALILPLMNENTILGVMVLGKCTYKSLFTELDYTFMKSYARFVTITLDNFRKYQEVVHKHELNREIGVAAEIQKTLLPGRIPRMKALQIGAYSNAAKGVSGDYYDVFPLDSTKTAIIICDVSGKGIPASLFMVMIRTVIRTVSSPSMNAAEILQNVNQQITGNFRTGTFATISLLIVDQKNYQMSYANGAHYPLYVYKAKAGKFLKFDADGLPLGIDIHASFGHKKIKIEPNDYMMLFTDGLPEARNSKGEELSTNRLLQHTLKYVGKGPGQMKDGVQNYLKKYCKNTKQHDDETFVAIKII